MTTILTWPHKQLAKKATPVPEGERCRELIDTMFESMNYPNGIGLAAPQIGVDKRIIVINVPAFRKGVQVSGSTKHHIINPVITWRKGALEMGYEGCLSVPDEQIAVPRYPRIKVQGFNLRWEPITIGGKGLVARVLQH
jgi:peptide deformylase